MNRIRLAAVAAALLCAVALTSCTGAPTPAGTDAGGEPSASATSPSPTPDAVEPAASCLQIDTNAPTVDGTTLGTCISEALHVIGTFKASSTMGGEPQDAEIRLRPDVAIHGTSPDDEVIFVDDVTYKNEGDGWVQGDANSDDTEEYIGGMAGQLLVAVFAGDVLKQTIAACPVWNIEVASKKLTLPDDQVVDTRVFSCAAPFDSFGTTVSPMHVWIGADWTPYGFESTATGYGQVIDGVSYYYDHGVPVEITAPM